MTLRRPHEDAIGGKPTGPRPCQIPAPPVAAAVRSTTNASEEAHSQGPLPTALCAAEGRGVFRKQEPGRRPARTSPPVAAALAQPKPPSVRWGQNAQKGHHVGKRTGGT